MLYQQPVTSTVLGNKMPRKEGKIQLNLSVDSWVKEVLKQTFENEGLSLAQGITKIAKQLKNNDCKLTGSIVTENYQSNPRTTSTVLDTNAIASTVLGQCEEKITERVSNEVLELGKKFGSNLDGVSCLISETTRKDSINSLQQQLTELTERINSTKVVTHQELEEQQDRLRQDLLDAIAALGNSIYDKLGDRIEKLERENIKAITPVTQEASGQMTIFDTLQSAVNEETPEPTRETAPQEQKPQNKPTNKVEASPCENTIEQNSSESELSDKPIANNIAAEKEELTSTDPTAKQPEWLKQIEPGKSYSDTEIAKIVGGDSGQVNRLRRGETKNPKTLKYQELKAFCKVKDNRWYRKE